MDNMQMQGQQRVPTQVSVTVSSVTTSFNKLDMQPTWLISAVLIKRLPNRQCLTVSSKKVTACPCGHQLKDVARNRITALHGLTTLDKSNYATHFLSGAHYSAIIYGRKVSLTLKEKFWQLKDKPGRGGEGTQTVAALWCADFYPVCIDQSWKKTDRCSMNSCGQELAENYDVF